jgi:hypothetical protein
MHTKCGRPTRATGAGRGRQNALAPRAPFALVTPSIRAGSSGSRGKGPPRRRLLPLSGLNRSRRDGRRCRFYRDRRLSRPPYRVSALDACRRSIRSPRSDQPQMRRARRGDATDTVCGADWWLGAVADADSFIVYRNVAHRRDDHDDVFRHPAARHVSLQVSRRTRAERAPARRCRTRPRSPPPRRPCMQLTCAAPSAVVERQPERGRVHRLPRRLQLASRAPAFETPPPPPFHSRLHRHRERVQESPETRETKLVWDARQSVRGRRLVRPL